MIRLLASWCVFWYLVWMLLAVAAPVVAEKRAKPALPPLEAVCPDIRVLHGVGGRQGMTYVKHYDTCSPKSAGVRIYKRK